MIEGQEETYREPPVLGYLKAGAASTGGIGKNQGFWRFQPEEKYKGAGALFRDVYGDKPTSLNIYLPGETVIDCFDQWMVEFGKRTKQGTGGSRGYLKKKCTTQRIVRYINPDQKKGQPSYLNTPKPCEAPHCSCERYGVFRFYIVELFAGGYMTPVQFSTKSPNHRSMFEKVLEEQAIILLGFGRSLLGARMLLEKVEETISKPQFEGSGKDAKLVPGVRDFGKEWMVNLRPDPEWSAQIMREAHARTLTGSSTMMVLPQDLDHVVTSQRVLTPATVQEMRQPPQMLDTDRETGRLRGFAFVQEMRQPPQMLEAELVEDEFKPVSNDRANSNRVKKVANKLWTDAGAAAEAIKVVGSMLYPGRAPSQLRDGHCDRFVDELLVMWGAQQRDHEGLEIFAGQEDARLFYQKEGPANGSDAAKQERWVAIVEGFKKPKR